MSFFLRIFRIIFLFDGERWSDFAINGVKEDIKESVHILTGLSAYRLAMMHLKDSGILRLLRNFGKISKVKAIYMTIMEEN